MYNWLAIQPLIGGMAIAAEKVFNAPPKEIITYGDIPNERHLKEYYKKRNINVPFNIISNNSAYELKEPIDAVVAVPVCSGLSMMNSCSNGENSRGANAKQNDNMYQITELALGTIKPKAFIFENAPNLATPSGKPVLKKLQQMGNSFGYSTTIIKTSTAFHGIPQNRHRTFMIFWNSEQCPSLSQYQREMPTFKEYLSEIPEWASQQTTVNTLTEDPIYTFLSHKYEDFRHEMIKSSCKSFNRLLVKNNLIEEAIHFTDDERCKKSLQHIQNKVSNNKNFWDSSATYFENETNAIIGKYMDVIIHPIEDRYLNIRELMHLMGLPHDFDLINEKDYGHISQNVPVNTAMDWINEIKKFIDGDISYSLFAKNLLYSNYTGGEIIYD